MNQTNAQGQPNGPWQSYYSNGQIWLKGSYVDGVRHGPWEEFHNNGQLSAKGSYINGTKVGVWEENNYI